MGLSIPYVSTMTAVTAAKPMRAFRLRPRTREALTLLDKAPDGLHPRDFYRKFWPQGNKHGKDLAEVPKPHGGPSAGECAANWFLGRLKARRLVDRTPEGLYLLTTAGRELLFTKPNMYRIT